MIGVVVELIKLILKEHKKKEKMRVYLLLKK